MSTRERIDELIDELNILRDDEKRKSLDVQCAVVLTIRALVALRLYFA